MMRVHGARSLCPIALAALAFAPTTALALPSATAPAEVAPESAPTVPDSAATAPAEAAPAEADSEAPAPAALAPVAPAPVAKPPVTNTPAAAVHAAPPVAANAPSGPSDDPFACASKGREHPDLSAIRYDDPRCRKTAWLGIDAGGVVLPAKLGLFDRTLWTVNVTPAWSVRLARWMSLGGRHGMGWYDAGNIRLRVHTHQVELAAHPVEATGHRRVHDRLVAGVETHALAKATVDGVSFKLGGVRDTVVFVGYGVDHAVARRWTLGWHAQFRHAWVLNDTQRQVRASVRAAFYPRPAHRIALEAVAFVVHRNRDQAGTPLPRVGGYGQFALDYGWMSRFGVGPAVRVRATTAFLAGEAPVWEIREEALDAPFAELIVGIRGVWR